ncbi:MAG: hypothetical protein AAF809_15020 [Bacteroidota bacterium]
MRLLLGTGAAVLASLSVTVGFIALVVFSEAPAAESDAYLRGAGALVVTLPVFAVVLSLYHAAGILAVMLFPKTPVRALAIWGVGWTVVGFAILLGAEDGRIGLPIFTSGLTLTVLLTGSVVQYVLCIRQSVAH